MFVCNLNIPKIILFLKENHNQVNAYWTRQIPPIRESELQVKRLHLFPYYKRLLAQGRCLRLNMIKSECIRFDNLTYN